MQYIIYLRYIVGGLLLTTGLLKIPNLNDFYTSVARYDFFSVLFDNFLPFVVRLFVLFEIIIGLLLITGHMRRTVLGVASLLVIIFIGLSIYDYIVGSGHSCGCFGGIEILESSSEWRILQNSVLLFLLLATLRYDKSLALNWSVVRWLVSFLGIIMLALHYFNY